MNATNSPIRNWKREPLVWMLIAIPLSAVIMGVVMITLAIQSFSGLVVDDYYKKNWPTNSAWPPRFRSTLSAESRFASIPE